MEEYMQETMHSLMERLNRIEYKLDIINERAEKIVQQGQQYYADADLPMVSCFTEEEWPEFLIEEGADSFTTAVAIGDVELNADEMLHVNWDILYEEDK